jgi:uncharacterized protein YfbU (UPF0304 family)
MPPIRKHFPRSWRTNVLNLTEVERRILINQSRILAALYPLETTEFERTAEILSEGYHEDWPDTVLKGLKVPLLKEEMNFVYQVLDMYDWLQKSYYSLTFEEKLQLKERALVFPGFHAESESQHLAYARFLLENLDRFSFTEVVKPLNSPRPMREVYQEMLNELPTSGGDMLSGPQLKAVVAYLSGIDGAPRHGDAS